MTSACLLILAVMVGYVENDEPHIVRIVEKTVFAQDCSWMIGKIDEIRGLTPGLPRTYVWRVSDVPIPREKPKL